jgi:hypothetical protein
MPRKPALLLPNVPLVLIAFAIRMEVEHAGERLERIVIERTSRHFYNLAIHTQPVRQVLQAGPKRAGMPGWSGAVL